MAKEKKQQKKEVNALLTLKLPSPKSGNEDEGISYSEHNKAAKRNFTEVASLFQKILSNQRIIAASVATLSERVTNLDDPKKIAENLKELIDKDN